MTWSLSNIGGEERPLAPAPDLGVDGHRFPVFGAVPADSVLAVVSVDLYRVSRSGEVDEVYMLMVGADGANRALQEGEHPVVAPRGAGSSKNPRATPSSDRDAP